MLPELIQVANQVSGSGEKRIQDWCLSREHRESFGSQGEHGIGGTSV